MRRIDTTQADLHAAIDAEKPGWLAKAKKRTAQYKTAGKYGAGSEFWGDIKNVYIDLQHEKCAYCETKLAGKQLASKVHEVEHFRPKSKVSKWPAKAKKGVTPFVPPCKVGGESENGYYLLAYHPLNYAIACTRCNSTLKSDYFPVRGRRNIQGSDPTKLKGEDALLIYPMGDIDADPSDLIRFDGVLAVPAKTRGKNFERALITIEFFKLNHEDLTTRRAQIIAMLWRALRTLELGNLPSDLRNDTQSTIDLSVAASGQFSSCARDFVDLYSTNKTLANEYGRLAQDLVGN
ncbi:hypothetical protein [Lysobacter sp. FW306-1B-D06B]|uniref:hypothetical protein n=1 Tax=Lysobacter sp. FW306-1B-D06B TaxID=3140250 RepID=UPI0031409488